MNKYKIKNLISLALALFLTLLLAISTSSCNLFNPSTQKSSEGKESVTSEVETEVITLYFAKYTEDSAYLMPEERKVEKSNSLPLVAVQELIKGPEVSDLSRTLPETTKVLSVDVDRGIATVDFSKEIITDSGIIGPSSTTELLAIFSIVNTLTEFSQIKEVKITVEGKSSGQMEGREIADFWGHVGISQSFARNDALIGPAQETAEGSTETEESTSETEETTETKETGSSEETTKPDLGMPEPTKVMSAGTKIDGKDITSIRYGDHEGEKSRFVFDIKNADGSDSDVVPYAVASYYAELKKIHIVINGVRQVSDDLQVNSDPWLFPNDKLVESISNEVIEDDQAVMYVIILKAGNDFNLFALKNPSRLVIDIFKK
ncbi:MAG: GerMN domain-containing protein [Actinobacteria bacterium]|nr:GerMN domain-containing protein [Actinomycetota bacterium]